MAHSHSTLVLPDLLPNVFNSISNPSAHDHGLSGVCRAAAACAFPIHHSSCTHTARDHGLPGVCAAQRHVKLACMLVHARRLIRGCCSCLACSTSLCLTINWAGMLSSQTQVRQLRTMQHAWHRLPGLLSSCVVPCCAWPAVCWTMPYKIHVAIAGVTFAAFVIVAGVFTASEIELNPLSSNLLAMAHTK